jgi:flagellar hook-associated protein 2
VSFTAGTTSMNDSSATALSHTPTDVDADAAFDDPDLNLRPRFDGGAQVTAGSFVVNGTTVAVYAGDTINSVLARISSLVPGISASFAGDKATLRTTAASEQDIVVGSDTSGFLAAVKLDGATTARGNVHDDVETFAQSAKLGSVVTGSFSVNGVAIAVDRDNDSLQSVLARINASGAGVTATYDAAADQVVFTPDTPGATLVLDGDTSGFLDAVGLFSGARLPTRRSTAPAPTIRCSIRG